MFYDDRFWPAKDEGHYENKRINRGHKGKACYMKQKLTGNSVDPNFYDRRDLRDRVVKRDIKQNHTIDFRIDNRGHFVNVTHEEMHCMEPRRR